MKLHNKLRDQTSTYYSMKKQPSETEIYVLRVLYFYNYLYQNWNKYIPKGSLFRKLDPLRVSVTFSYKLQYNYLTF